MKSAIQFACSTVSGLFVWFATLQFNDVDAPLWIIAYGLAAAISALCAVPLFSRRLILPSRILSGIYAIWCLVLLQRTSGQWWDGEIEREVGGLAIAALWMLMISIIARRMSRFQ